MKITWTFLFFIFVNLVFATLGDTSTKMWAIHPGPKWFWIMLGINILTQVTFMLVIRNSGLAIGSSLVLLLLIVTTTCIGFFVFREKIFAEQWLGIILGLFSTALILRLIKFS